MRALILANGDPPSAALARNAASEADLIIAADGAANRAAALGIEPHIICGDFDSIARESAEADFPCARFIPTPDQEFADLQKAIDVAYEEGATSLIIIGAGGGRIDHLLANYALLLCRPDRDICIRDDRGAVRAVGAVNAEAKTLDLETAAGDTVSLLCMGAPAVVSITGVRWPLDRFPLEIGTHGVSNEAVATAVRVTVHGGALLVCRLPIQH